MLGDADKSRLSRLSARPCCAVLQCEYEIQVQLLEIYNEQLRDLLDNTKSHSRLDIRNTERSGLNVPDAIQVSHLLERLQCLPRPSLCAHAVLWRSDSNTAVPSWHCRFPAFVNMSAANLSNKLLAKG